MMKVAAGLVLLLLIGCGTASDSAPQTIRTSAEDLRWLDTLREIDERSSALVATAKFDAARQELRAFADIVGHEHRKRTDAIDRWRERAFDAEPARVALPECVAQMRTIPARSADSVLLAGLIEQRGCMLAYAQDARTNVQSAEVQRIIDDTIRTVSAELQQLQTWNATWTK